MSQTHLWVQTEHGHTFAPPSIGLSGLWARAGSVRIVRWKIEERKPRGKGLSLHPFPPNNGSRARYSELMDKGVSWELNEAYFPDGYAYKHHNVYDLGSFSARLNATLGVFTDPASQASMADLHPVLKQHFDDISRQDRHLPVLDIKKNVSGTRFAKYP